MKSEDFFSISLFCQLNSICLQAVSPHPSHHTSHRCEFAGANVKKVKTVFWFSLSLSILQRNVQGKLEEYREKRREKSGSERF